MPDPESPEWSVACAAKQDLDPKFDRRLPLFLAKAILERMRLSKWRISKEPPDPSHSTPVSDARREDDCGPESARGHPHPLRLRPGRVLMPITLLSEGAVRGKTTIWKLKKRLRCRSYKQRPAPKFDRRLPLFLAKTILERVRLTKWRITKEAPNPPHSTPGE